MSTQIWMVTFVGKIWFQSLGRCSDGLVLVTREMSRWSGLVTRGMLRWSGFGPLGGAWSDYGNSGDVRGCVILF